jgi:hypothetical protein
LGVGVVTFLVHLIVASWFDRTLVMNSDFHSI